MTAHIDVLIPTRDRHAPLVATLSGLAAQGCPRLRVLVGDQSDGPPAWGTAAARAMVRVLEHAGHTVTLTRLLPRRGPAEQRACLLDLATADHVLFLDDDVWLEPGGLLRLYRALRRLGCGFVGYAPQDLSQLADERPDAWAAYEEWAVRPEPELIERGSPRWARRTLHEAAVLTHIADRLGLRPDEWRAYKIAWIGGCVLYERAALTAVGGFDFWRDPPPDHAGAEADAGASADAAAQLRVLATRGGAGIVPSAAVRLASPTTAPAGTAPGSRTGPAAVRMGS